MNYLKVASLLSMVFLFFPVIVFGAEMENIQASILNNTPKVISDSLINSVNNLEKTRKSIEKVIQTNKTKAEKQLEVLTEKQVKEIRDSTRDPKVKPDYTSKFFKYIQLFFLSGFFYIFSYQIIFYLVLFSILYYMIRSIIRLFF